MNPRRWLIFLLERGFIMKNRVKKFFIIALFICALTHDFSYAHELTINVEEDYYNIKNIAVEKLIFDQEKQQFYTNGLENNHAFTITGDIWSKSAETIEITAKIKTVEKALMIDQISENEENPSTFSIVVDLNEINLEPGDTETIYLKIIDESLNESLLTLGEITYDQTIPAITIEPLEIKYDEKLIVNVSEPGYLYLIPIEEYNEQIRDLESFKAIDQAFKTLIEQGKADQYYIATQGIHQLNVNNSHGFLRYIYRDFSGNFTDLSNYSIYLNNEKPTLIDQNIDEHKVSLIYDKPLVEQNLLTSDFFVSKENIKTKAVYYYIIDDLNEINYKFGYNDYENDPKKLNDFWFEHSPEIFTNNRGIDPLNNQSIQLETYDFNYPGEYHISYRAQDDPTENLSNSANFDDYKKWSTLTEFSVIAHRRPIANVTVDKEIIDGLYHLQLNTVGYDLDHMDLEQKGIVDKELQWKKVDDPHWNAQALPTTLSADHEYMVRYRVKDLEQAWSNYAVDIINEENENYLYLNVFSDPEYPEAIPIKEELKFFCDIYTNDVIESVTLISPKGTVYDLAFEATYEEFLRYSLVYKIPQNLRDQDDYCYTVDVKTQSGLTQQKEVNVNVKTPINLTVDMDERYSPGDQMTMTAVTSKYVKEVKANLFEETDNATEQRMTLVKEENDLKYWELTYAIPDQFLSGHYNCDFTAATYNTQQQHVHKLIEISGIELLEFNVEGKWHQTGSVFYSLEKIDIDVKLRGEADDVSITLKDPLGSMTYIDPYGNKYLYSDFFDKTLQFPLKLNKVSNDLYTIAINLPLVDRTIDRQGNRIKQPYTIALEIIKNNDIIIDTEKAIDIDGNIYDHIQIQEKNY